VNTPIETVGPLAVAVPAVVAGLAAAHQRFGTLAWADVLEPAIRLAREGIHFPSPGREQIFDDAPRFKDFSETMRVFVHAWDDHTLRQPDLESTLATLAREGPKAMYGGDIGATIVGYLRAEGGLLDMRDLTEYAVEIGPAQQSVYRGFDVFTPGSATGGGVVVPLLRNLERVELGVLEPLGAERMCALVEATGAVWRERLGHKTSVDAGCTDHLVVGDTRGNVVSVTTTLQMLMGSGVTVPGTGVVLNNGMGLFDSAPDRSASIGPGKKSITNMCPTIVLQQGRPVLAIGASGGRPCTS
jgi:gamma-glutamyltranspeptidase/glutathione hydrolase